MGAHVQPPTTSPSSPQLSSSAGPTSAQRNLELLKSILADFTQEELSNEIFMLNEVQTQAKGGPRMAKPATSTTQNTASAGQK